MQDTKSGHPSWRSRFRTGLRSFFRSTGSHLSAAFDPADSGISDPSMYLDPNPFGDDTSHTSSSSLLARLPTAHAAASVPASASHDLPLTINSSRLPSPLSHLWRPTSSVLASGTEATAYGVTFQSAIVAALGNPKIGPLQIASAIRTDCTNPKFLANFWGRNTLITALDKVVEKLNISNSSPYSWSGIFTSFASGATEAALTAKLENRELTEQLRKPFSSVMRTAPWYTLRNSPLYMFLGAQREYLKANPNANPLQTATAFSFAATASSLPFHSIAIGMHDGIEPQQTLRNLFKSAEQTEAGETVYKDAETFFQKSCNAIKNTTPPKAALGRFVGLLTLFYPLAKSTLQEICDKERENAPLPPCPSRRSKSDGHSL